ncbi:ATP-dependent RNA helicase HrpA [Catellatospora methionotrophica]|uniref:RNA helicase n=1 Tax=Catellatospora methionotrophica TaxID=121620 RepID=A0A8J3L829_9ACTN|nr:ATP-dependent RNA helicase HrpA [Catellatospora methionotrophica]GIG13453.1 ATP-dependent RNA helicase HrpA [Catellatospora methionotrophica]
MTSQSESAPLRNRPPRNPSQLTELRKRVDELTAQDRRRLGRRLDGVRRTKPGAALDAAVAQITAAVVTAEEKLALRAAGVPTVTYPAELPVSQKRDDIADAIRDHQVVIVAGETGSGKTTQIPKICLELGRGLRGLIGHTQPRRLAARTVAERIAEELDTPLGGVVGWKVRFTDHVGDQTMIKLMTDGILLAEIQHDRTLSMYDTLIIDEAHERSLNIDFILGYLKQLLPRRPDLKVIITSATIDPERFAAHFATAVVGGEAKPAPIVEVSGRTYPVEVRYRPLVVEGDEEDGDSERDQIQAISDAVDELAGEAPGDVLVFLSGEREIRDTADMLRKRNLRHTEILPLYARLSTAEQHKVFQQHTGRRIVLATNVAETSLTVPGIKYVVDPGTARISRYSNRLKVQRLPIEAVSQASANQRKGRCGRLSDGIAIRLYEEADFLGRPEFTEPEILRTNLASVILQMISLGLGDIAAFPFIDPPDRRNIADGLDLLHELGALEAPVRGEPGKLTPLGRKLAQLPVDPRLGRMVLEADRNGCLREVLIITAALSIQDPRERPADKQQAAGEKHARFADKDSDFTAFLNLWNWIKEQQQELSSNQFRRTCKTDFLHYLRIREWQDLESQLRQVVKGMGFTLNTVPADAQRLHQSLLAGLLSHIGMHDPEKRDFIGARNARFSLFPGSSLFKKSPKWVMAAELVETSRLWGRIAAKIEPEWAESLAEHLVKRQYSEPHWEKKQAAVLAYEKVTLYGIPIVAKRKVNFGRIDPALSRELFIRHALVDGDWETHHEFFHANRDLLAEVEELEHRVRRRDILVDDGTLFDFYDERLPADIVSGRHFDSWWKKARHETPDLLSFEKSMLVNEAAGGVDEDDYPDVWQQGEFELPLTYQFEPGTNADGVTVHIPLPLLNQITPAGFDWQIPGVREELAVALVRSLPKAVRRNFVPVPDYVKEALAGQKPDGQPLLALLERQLRAMTGVVVAREAWEPDKVPDHLRMTFRVEDEQGKTLAEGKDLAELKRRLRDKAQAAVAAAADDMEQHGLRTWTIGPLAKVVERQRGTFGGGSVAVKGYPALVDEGDSVGVGVFDSPGEQWNAMWRGTRRLVLLGAPPPLKSLQGRLSNQAKLALSRNPHGSVGKLLEDVVTSAVDKAIIEAGGPAWDADAFAALVAKARADMPDTMYEILQQLDPILSLAYDIDRQLKSITNVLLVRSVADIRAQLTGLVYPGFVAATGLRKLPDLVRYLRAVEQRLAKLPESPQRDRERLLLIEDVQQEYTDARAAIRPGAPGWDTLTEVRWMIEELRVSYFAQSLGTPYPVSDKRIYRALATLPA